MITGLLILLPIAGSVAVMFSLRERAVRRTALLFTVAELVLAIYAAAGLKGGGEPQYIFSLPWLKGLNVPFIFGIDGASMLMVLLTTFLIPVILLASASCQSRRLNIFFGLILLAEGALVGVFTALNGLVFYVFWEFALIPVYFIIAIWGGENRIKVTFKFLIYTLTGSLIMLAALIWLYFQTPMPHSFSFAALCQAVTGRESQMWLFSAFMLAFAIKIPLVPFHTWQPDAYASAPPAGSMILAGIMLKMGIYGIFRLLIPVTPLALKTLGTPVIIVIITGVIYASVIAIRLDDLKRFIAWVSIAHVGLISAALLSLNSTAIQGALFQAVAHGINVTGLFIIVDIMEVRFKTRRISELGGIAGQIPAISVFLMIIILGSVALPLTSGFAGEFLMLLGLFSYSPWIAAGAGLTIILSAVYMLKMYQSIMLGNFNTALNPGPQLLRRSDFLVLTMLVMLIFILGIYPSLLTNLTSPVTEMILKTIKILPI